MNQEIHDKMNTYFASKLAACAAEAAALEADDRKDEAIFARIRGNVYDIFRTVFSVALNTEADAAGMFRKKLDEIPRNWQTARQLAETHGNSGKAHIEDIKLQTAAEIRRVFEAVREESI